MTEFLAAAASIGDRLCADAIWSSDRTCCNWMGRTDVEDANQASNQVASRALGAHIYGGSGGVALFFCALAGATNLDAFAGAALGAARHALRAFRRDPGPASPLSHFSGVLGLASVLAATAEMAATDEFVDDIAWAVGCAARGATEVHARDVMGGDAGAVPPLLRLWRRHGRADCRDLAFACGRDICRSATWQGEVCFWDSVTSSGPLFRSPPVTGYSHGASGLALALLELHAAGFRDEDALSTARGAWRYEDSLFNPEVANWIDVRMPFHVEDGLCRGTFHAAWCHGASGIALARARAATLDVERAAEHRRMAEAGLGTALAAAERDAAEPRHDASLCHGLCGQGEIALTCGELLNDARWSAAARALGTRLVARHGRAGPWPSAAPGGGPNPTLMLGDAGIGHHLLRLHDPAAVPSVLVTLPN